MALVAKSSPHRRHLGSVPARTARYTFAILAEETPGLDGPQRAAAFDALPETRQREAWAQLRADVDARERLEREEVVS